ncbi:MAG: inlA 5 [Planctomycetaceae bacterium]|nr:inlA 5 [Planctomycetaceae bacterium]
MIRLLLTVMTILGILCDTTFADPAKQPSTAAQREAAVQAVKAIGGVVDIRSNVMTGAKKTNVLLGRSEQPDQVLKQLVHLENLVDISLHDSGVTDAGLKELLNLSELTALDLRGCKQVTDAGIKSLTKLTNLTHLSLNLTDVGDEGIKSLASLTNLQDLDLTYTQVTDAGLQELGVLKKLTNLDLEQTKVGSAGMSAVANMESLKSLNLDVTAIDDSGLKALSKLKALAFLNLADTKVTDNGMQNLVAIKNLSYVNLRGTAITDAAIKTLASCPNLTNIGVVQTAITDAGLKEIPNYKKLTIVFAKETKVTPAGVNALRKLLPMLRVDSDFPVSVAPDVTVPRMIAYQGPTMKTPPAADAPVRKVTARVFHDDLESDDKGAAKYDGGWVQVEGLVTGISVDRWVSRGGVFQPFKGEHLVIVQMEAAGKQSSYFSCWMAAGERPWEQALEGETITMRGAYTKSDGVPLLAECRIIKPSKKKMLNVTVDELAKKYETNKELFTKSNENKHAVVTGKYAGHIAPPAEGAKADPEEWIALDGKKGRRFYAYIGSSILDKNLFAGIMPGEQVTVLGEFTALSLEDGPFEDLHLQRSMYLTPFMPGPKAKK